MSDCQNINCCPANEFSYNIYDNSQLNLRVISDPEDGGVTTGAGAYAIGDEVTVTETPSVPTSIDVAVDMVFVVDESGSMVPTLQTVMAGVTADLESNLIAAGIGSGSLPNRYACVAFGQGDPAQTQIDFEDGDTFAAAAAVLTAIPNAGGTYAEDAYEGIDYAINQMGWRAQGPVSRVIFFITDEDRQSTDPGPPDSLIHIYNDGATQADQFESIKQQIVSGGFILAGMHNPSTVQLRDVNNNIGIAASYAGICWLADGAGGYIVSSGPVNNVSGTFSIGDTDPPFPTGQKEEYYDLLMDTDVKGYYFAINQYRANPTTAQSVVATIVPALADRITQELVWSFVGWYDAGGQLLSTNSSYTFNILAPLVLTARFEHA